MQHDYLTDLEVSEIEKFNSNPSMSDAVKKVLFAVINVRGAVGKGKKIDPFKNGALGLVSLANAGKAIISNEMLGEDLRAYYTAIELLESGFKELTKVKLTKEEGTPETNPAI